MDMIKIKNISPYIPIAKAKGFMEKFGNMTK